LYFDLLPARFPRTPDSYMQAHLALFLPLQVLLQALFLQKTVLFMPVLYIIFGMPVNILIIIALYSWGMTWFFRSAQKF
jgi:hypothetical protein